MIVPGDGVVNPTDIIQAYTKGAVKNGRLYRFISFLFKACTIKPPMG